MIGTTIDKVLTIAQKDLNRLANEQDNRVRRFATVWYFAWCWIIVYGIISLPGYLIDVAQAIAGAL